MQHILVSFYKNILYRRVCPRDRTEVNLVEVL